MRSASPRDAWELPPCLFKLQVESRGPQRVRTVPDVSTTDRVAGNLLALCVAAQINCFPFILIYLFIRGRRRLLRAIAVGARGQQGFYGLRPARVARSPQRRRRRAAASSAEPPSAELKRRHPWASRLVPPRASCVCPRIPALLVDAGLPSQHLAPARAGACRLGAFLRPRPPPHVKGPRFCAHAPGLLVDAALRSQHLAATLAHSYRACQRPRRRSRVKSSSIFARLPPRPSRRRGAAGAAAAPYLIAARAGAA